MGLFADVNAGVEHITNGGEGLLSLPWSVGTSWRTNLQSAWFSRGRHILQRISDRLFEQEVEELRAFYELNRNHPDFARWQVDFERFVDWEIENFILLREMMPAIEGFERKTMDERSPWADFLFLTDHILFTGVDIDTRQKILNQLKETGSADRAFLEYALGHGVNKDYVSRVDLVFFSSQRYMNYADIHKIVLGESMAQIQAGSAMIGAFTMMRMAQRPGMIGPQVRGIGGAGGGTGGGGPEMTRTSQLQPTHRQTLSNRQMNKLTNDIRANGIREPIKYVVHNGQKYVVDGHHRLIAARRLGIKEVPTQKVELPFRGYKTLDDVLWFD